MLYILYICIYIYIYIYIIFYFYFFYLFLNYCIVVVLRVVSVCCVAFREERGGRRMDGWLDFKIMYFKSSVTRF